MEIIRRLIKNWRPRQYEKSDYGKYQYLYRNNGRTISLVYLEIPRRKFMWEACSLSLNTALERRFKSKEEAEESIMLLLLGDELEDLIEWKVAKQNIIIQE